MQCTIFCGLGCLHFYTNTPRCATFFFKGTISVFSAKCYIYILCTMCENIRAL